MPVQRTAAFEKALKKLPAHAQRLFHRQEDIFRANWLDPRLHTKRIRQLKGVYSIRITRRYRALFYFKQEEPIFFAIGHRKEIYK